MSLIKPFKGIRPVKKFASQIASPPYDVMNSDEAREMAKENPLSFLHVVKPEIDLPPGTDSYSDEVYNKGKTNLEWLQKEGYLIKDETPSLYLYRQIMKIHENDHVQYGIVAGASTSECNAGLIKKHEFTRADKEADRTRHVNTLNANTGPVFLTYRADKTINKIVNDISILSPEYDFTADDGIVHTFWVINDQTMIEKLIAAFKEIPALYIADGHHRSASACTVAKNRKAANPNHTGDEEYNFFLSVIFPDDQMYIMDYNRVVSDLNGLDHDEFIKQVNKNFEVKETSRPSPDRALEFGMYLNKKWYRLKAKEETFDLNDPVRSLDVAILQNNLLAPVLGIGDPRTDNRIDFVGGIRGTKELEKRVDNGSGVAFAMYPTSIEQLMAIADAGKVMPPKSTWFEPKLRSGLIIKKLD
jgi:uncharacterized protein (DUF1015 family)